MFDSEFGNSVLLVDDSPMDLATIKSQLHHAGCAVQTTDSHNCALELIVQDQEINVVILDHGITGGRVASFIIVAKTIRPELFVVGSSSSDCRREFTEAGADCFLRKPWQVAELIDALKSRYTSDSEGSDGNSRCGAQFEMASSATRLGNGEADTTCLKFSSGERVRVAVGRMEGLAGTVSETRSGGRILLRMTDGVFVEIHQYVLERVDCSRPRPNVADSFKIERRDK